MKASIPRVLLSVSFPAACLIISGCVTMAPQRYSPLENTREEVISGNVSKAARQYKELIDQSSRPDSGLISEYAYSLALAGHYEPALVNLDCARLSDPAHIPVYFYASQVYSLVGFPNDQLATELWPSQLRSQTLGWIRANAAGLAKEYRAQRQVKPIDDLAEEFSKANLLLSQQCYFQAIAVFDAITRQFPGEYLPYTGYSIALEKAGAPRCALKALNESVRIAGKDGMNRQMAKQVQARIKMLENKIRTETPAEAKDPQSLGIVKNNKNSLFYIGGQLSDATSGLNMRLGICRPGGLEFGADLGISDNVTGGVSVFSTLGVSKDDNPTIIPVLGCGLKQSSSDTFFVGTAGIRIPVRDKANSLDLMMDIELTEVPRVVFTLGMTTYMGQR